MTTQVDWGDGSGDKIYLTCNALEGDQIVSVSSDANTGAARSKVVTFTSGVGSITRTLTVEQAAGVVEHTFTAQLSSYIAKATDGSWSSISGTSNAYTTETSSNYCAVQLTKGANAESWIYFKYDTSSIPADATILSVQVVCKVWSQTTNANQVASRRVGLYSGTTAKDADALIPNPANTRTLGGTDWTREEVRDIRLRLYGVRGTSNTDTSYAFRLYGSTLTIKYTTPQ